MNPESWNALYPVGTLVVVTLRGIGDEPIVVYGRTNSPALNSVLDGRAFIEVETRGYPLACVSPLLDRDWTPEQTRRFLAETLRNLCESRAVASRLLARALADQARRDDEIAILARELSRTLPDDAGPISRRVSSGGKG